MGSVYPRGRKLWLRYKDQDDQWTQTKTDYVLGQEEEATNALKKLEAKIKTEKEFNKKSKSKGPVTVEKYAKQWIDRRKELVASWTDDESRLKKHVLPTIGKMPMVEVRPRHLVDVFMRLRKANTLAPKSIHSVYGAVKGMFRDAFIDDLIPVNPAVLTKVQLGGKEDRDPEWRATAFFDKSELVTLISEDNIPPDRRLVYALGGIGGLRHGEIAGLHWRHYEIDRQPLGKLVVARSYEGLTKTRMARGVPVHPTLAAMLTDWRTVYWPQMVGREPTSEDLLIPSRETDMRSKNHTRNKLHDDLRRLKLRPRRVHDLRRTFITLCRADGARPDILRWVTHTPNRSDMMELYSSLPWVTLCEEVLKLKIEKRPSTTVDTTPTNWMKPKE